MALKHRQLGERSINRSAFLDEVKRVCAEREANKPEGLAGFLSKIIGVELIGRKLHQHQDKQSHEKFQLEKAQMLAQQHEQKRRAASVTGNESV